MRSIQNIRYKNPVKKVASTCFQHLGWQPMAGTTDCIQSPDRYLFDLDTFVSKLYCVLCSGIQILYFSCQHAMLILRYLCAVLRKEIRRLN
ncbi:hypothetical protein DVH24_009600 [Malus domestica]|uniref:Uncharacterized protein n=1 Tax=Malus domestica TaxID=3750 RepID=A0A498JLZ4_MALDO|nr:hypothetical protein DVH24_009600 [Malus domestica]